MGKKKVCEQCKELKVHKAFGLCRKCYYKEYCVKNRERLRERKKEYRAKNKTEIKAYAKKYKKEHQVEVKEYQKKYKSNPKNKERARERRRIWSKTPKGKLITLRDRLKRRASGTVKKGDLSKLLNENIFKYGIITCEKCKEECEENYHTDHIKPISKGGGNEYKNLQILCAHCNHVKYTDTMDYKYVKEGGQLYLK